MKSIVVTVLLVLGLWVGTVGAQAVYPDRPMHLRITGTLLSADAEKREDFVLASIFVQDKPWLLRVGKVEDLNPSGRGEQVKEDILLREVRFYGPDSLLARLQKGKVLTIEGQLDTKARRFLVTAVKEGASPTPQNR
jgi:hypothetical protein